MAQLKSKSLKEAYSTYTCLDCDSEFLPEDVPAMKCLNCHSVSLCRTESTASWKRILSYGD